MNTIMRLVAGLSLVVIAGCASAPHQSRDEQVQTPTAGQQYRQMLVLVVADDEAKRISSEASLSALLNQQGLTTNPSHKLFPAPLPEAASAEQSRRLAQYDGVLIVTLEDEGYEYDYADHLALRGWVYLLGGKPGSGSNIGSLIAWAGSGHYQLNLSLWDTQTGDAVWQAGTDSTRSDSESEDLQALAKHIAARLRAHRLVSA